LDRFAVLQEWEGIPNRLIVFGLPEEKRKRKNAKNYFSIYAVYDNNDSSLKCEVVFPKNEHERKRLLEIYDPMRMLRISSINEIEGDFKPKDFDYLINLIQAAREQRLVI